MYLACGLIVRGAQVEISDINRNVERLTKKLGMIHWNKEGFKVGHCYQPPLNMTYSMLALSNNTGTRHVLSRLRARFNKIYKQRVFVHHYEQFMDVEQFDVALQNCTNVIANYSEMERLNFQAQEEEQKLDEDTYKYRFKPII